MPQPLPAEAAATAAAAAPQPIMAAPWTPFVAPHHVIFAPGGQGMIMAHPYMVAQPEPPHPPYYVAMREQEAHHPPPITPTFNAAPPPPPADTAPSAQAPAHSPNKNRSQPVRRGMTPSNYSSSASSVELSPRPMRPHHHSGGGYRNGHHHHGNGGNGNGGGPPQPPGNSGNRNTPERMFRQHPSPLLPSLPGGGSGGPPGNRQGFHKNRNFRPDRSGFHAGGADTGNRNNNRKFSGLNVLSIPSALSPGGPRNGDNMATPSPSSNSPRKTASNRK